MAIKEAFTMRKLVATGAVITLIGTSGAYFASKNTEIQDRITKLYNIATGYKSDIASKQNELTTKNNMLNEIASYLGFNKDNPWDGTLDSLKTAINSKATGQSSADVQALLNKIATEKLGLPATTEDGSTINYTQNEVLNEIDTLYDEVTELENYINTYVEEGAMDETPYAGMTLKEKLEKMINDLTKASKEDEAQLNLANEKLVALGYCPVHGTKFNENGRCNDSKCEYAKVENVDDKGQSGNMTLPGGNNTGGTPATPAEPEGGTGGQGGNGEQEETGGTQPPVNQPAGGTPVTPDSTKLANFEKALKDNATKGISNKTINALVNDHDNYRLHANAYVVKKQADGTWVYDSEHSGYMPTKGSTPWTNIKNAYIAVFGNADLMQ